MKVQGIKCLGSGPGSRKNPDSRSGCKKPSLEDMYNKWDSRPASRGRFALPPISESEELSNKRVFFELEGTHGSLGSLEDERKYLFVNACPEKSMYVVIEEDPNSMHFKDASGAIGAKGFSMDVHRESNLRTRREVLRVNNDKPHTVERDGSRIFVTILFSAKEKMPEEYYVFRKNTLMFSGSYFRMHERHLDEYVDILSRGEFKDFIK